MVVVEPVVADGHDPPTVGSSEIQHHISAPSVPARMGGAVDHLSCVSGDAALAAGKTERHHHGIEARNNLSERHIARLTVGRDHLVMMVDQERIATITVARPTEMGPCPVARVADGVSYAIRDAAPTTLRGVVVWSGTGAGRGRGGRSAIARRLHGSVHDAHGSRPAGARGEVRGTSFDVLSVPSRDVDGSARRRKDPQIEGAAGAGRRSQPSGRERAHGARRLAGNLHVGVEHRHGHLLSCGATRWRTAAMSIK